MFYKVLLGKDIAVSNRKLGASFLNFSLYTFLLVLFCFIATKKVKSLIQKRNLDLDYYSLRNTNYWFQIFSARYLEMHGIQGERDKTDIIALDVLSDKGIIYSGFLLDFNYSPQKDELENIVLTSTTKRLFQTQPNTNGEIRSTSPTFIPGDVFVIPARQIVNVNIYYISLTGEVPETAAPV